MSESHEVPDSVESIDDLTRRQWILRLGELVALAGVSGVIPEFVTPLNAQSTATLPPGLYEPSQDHLVHALSSGGKNWIPPSGSETDYVIPKSLPYLPKFFSTEEFRIATRLFQILLGNVDPTALSEAVQWLDLYLVSAAGVRKAAQNLDPLHRVLAAEFFGEDSVRELETVDPQSIARNGLAALQHLSTQTYGRGFLQNTDAEQIALIKEAGNSQTQSELRKLYELARAEAIRGYYTSAQGLKELDYRGNAYYGDSPGCEPKA